jgi:ATP-binding cassette, subfamily B (MDR/TAP), member 1
LKESQK